MGIMRTKSIEQSIRDTEEPEFRLRKALGPLDLTLFGIGVIIGTGLFVLTGEAAAGYAGPAVALSYVVGGIVCALAALCYAEFASTVPVAGSAYTFHRGPGSNCPRSHTLPGSTAGRIVSDPHRAHGGGDNPDTRPEQGGLRHEPGQPAATVVLASTFAIPHALPDHDHNRRRRSAPRVLAAAGDARGAG
jgi:hypothetical protein